MLQRHCTNVPMNKIIGLRSIICYFDARLRIWQNLMIDQLTNEELSLIS